MRSVLGVKTLKGVFIMTTSKTLEELYAELISEAAKAVEIANDPEKTDADLKAAKKLMQEALNRYNEKAACDAYAAWAAEDSPAVYTALKTLYVPQAKNARVVHDKDAGMMKYAIDDNKTLKIDLQKMMETIGAEHFNDRRWVGAAQKMCYILAGSLSKELGYRADFQHFLREAGKAFEFSEDANPTSNNSAVKALQTVVDMIIFDPVENKKGDMVNKYKMEKKHFVYLQQCITRQGKNPGEVAMGNPGKLIELVCDLMYCIINGYELKLVG